MARNPYDDDVDRRLGNSTMSAAQAKNDDPRAALEYSNELTPQNQLQEQEAERMARRRHNQMRRAFEAAQSDVHFFRSGADSVKFVIPAENTYEAHRLLVEDNKQGLDFNPQKNFFDKILNDHLGIPALADRKHPDFDKYRNLRTNLEILRNDIIGMYLDDGKFNPGDEKWLHYFKAIAETLGTALANDAWWKRPFTNYMSLSVANKERVGAQEMYRFLLNQQDKSQILAPAIRAMRETFGITDKNWGLLPMEKSPFSVKNLTAPPPKLENLLGEDAPLEIGEQRATVALELINAVNTQRNPVSSMTVDDKQDSVEYGRKILRGLRNLTIDSPGAQELDAQDFLADGELKDQVLKARTLSALVNHFVNEMHRHPELHDIPQVKDASDAAGALAMMIAEHAISLLPEGHASRVAMERAIDTMPESYFVASHQPASRLLELVEQGLERMSGKNISEKTVADRLVSAGDHLQQKATQLRSVDTMEKPKRVESVELGREILRRLKDLSFDSKPLDEAVDTGRPEDKAELAEKLANLVDVYQQMLAQALATNSGLANDARIKQANDAAGAATHAIKLMASKEIPASMAQAQQIGADVTQMPEEWKGLEGRAVDRIIASMEGGLEAAAQEIAAQQQEQQQDEDREQSTEADISNNNARRKRRRRKQSSGMSGKKSERIMQETRADDRAAGQGAHAEDHKEKKAQRQSAFIGVDSKDIPALKDIGSVLMARNEEARAIPVMDVAAGTNVSPDGKSAAEAVIEAAKNSKSGSSSKSGGSSRTGTRRNSK